MSASAKALLALAAVGGGVAVFVRSGMSVEELVALGKAQMDDLETLLLRLGPWGPAFVFCLYLVTTVFMLPLWGFHMTCGWVYGTFWSALLIATTQALCAGAAFSMSRYVVGPRIRGWLERRFGRKFAAIDKAVSEDGLRITLLLRLSPIIPFGMNNYVCGVTQMKLWEFVVGTWLGVLPGTTAYCNMGALGKTALESGTTPLQKGAMAIGVVAAVAVIRVLSNLATNALREAGIEDDGDGVSGKSGASKATSVGASKRKQKSI